jgi:hypothetical protein
MVTCCTTARLLTSHAVAAVLPMRYSSKTTKQQAVKNNAQVYTRVNADRFASSKTIGLPESQWHCCHSIGCRFNTVQIMRYSVAWHCIMLHILHILQMVIYINYISQAFYSRHYVCGTVPARGLSYSFKLSMHEYACLQAGSSDMMVLAPCSITRRAWC